MTNYIFKDDPVASKDKVATENGTTATIVLDSGVVATTGSPPTLQWTARRIALATFTALGVACIFLLLYRFYMVVFIFFVAITLQIALRPAVAWLERRGIRQDLAIMLVYALLLVGIGGFIWLGVPLLINQISTVLQHLPEYYQNLRQYLLKNPSQLLHTLAASLPAQLSLSSVAASANSSTSDPITPAWTFIKTFNYAIFVFIVVLMLAFYWTLEGELITRRALLLAPLNQRDELRALLTEMETKVGAYFRGEAILCGIVGLLSMIAFFSIGIPYAFGLGVLMGLFEAIPTFGPSLAAIPVILVTLTTDPPKAIWALGAICVIQFLESHFIVPRVMDRSVGVNAVVTLLAIAGFGVLFGVIGAILAIPLAAILQILFKRLVFNEPVTEDKPTPTVTAEELERNRMSALRLEAQELVQDVRKQVRNEDETLADPNAERAEDLLEAIALDLDSLLTKLENQESGNSATTADNNVLRPIKEIL
ncbi:MAG: AI-2E family transporter [Caldilineaceae bacterium]